MANYDQYYNYNYNYDYNDHYNYNYTNYETSYDNSYETQYIRELDLGPLAYGPRSDSLMQYYANPYEQKPTQSLVGYYYSTNDPNQHDHFLATKNDYLNDNPLSTTQFITSYSNANGDAKDSHEKSDLDYEEYNPEPYGGGYDIGLTYGQALPPSNDICYPIGKSSSILNGDGSKFEGGGVEKDSGPVSNVEDEDGEEEEDEEEDGDDGEENVVQEFEGESNPTSDQPVIQDEKLEKEAKFKEEQRRQIPAGYGLEAMDICDGLFGGYFPCLRKKRNDHNCNQCGGNQVTLVRDEYEDWQGTVDYFFGNPNPYSGSMPEKGSYGDPVYSYQRSYPSEYVTRQVQYDENSSLEYYGRNNVDYQYY